MRPRHLNQREKLIHRVGVVRGEDGTGGEVAILFVPNGPYTCIR